MKPTKRTPALAHGVREVRPGEFLSISEMAYSNGAVVHPERHAAELHDVNHHTFMREHHPRVGERRPRSRLFSDGPDVQWCPVTITADSPRY